MIRFNSFEDRYEYLRLRGNVGRDTFGFNRFINQAFYQSRRWKSARSQAIIRDDGCDLADPGRPIGGSIFIHHINPVTIRFKLKP